MNKEELETNPFDSLHKTLVFSPRDWAFTSEDAWIYGIIVGWDNDCCKDFEKTFSWWTKKDTKRLKYMHSQFVKIARENGSKFCTFDALEHLADLEKENQKVKQGCHKWFMRWREVKRDELKAFSKIAELEKENAELKEKSSRQSKNYKCDVGKLLEENAEWKQRNETLKDALEHARKVYGDDLEKSYKEIAELKERVSYLEDNLRVARKDRENLQLDVAKGLKEFVKDYPATSLRYLANEKYVDQLTKAIEIIKKIIRVTWGEGWNYSLDWKVKAEQFIKDLEK